MKKYILFAGHTDEAPYGGIRDCWGNFDTIEEAKESIYEMGWSWADVVIAGESDFEVLWIYRDGSWKPYKE